MERSGVSDFFSFVNLAFLKEEKPDFLSFQLEDELEVSFRLAVVFKGY
jgi:hypothetical protein